MWGDMIRDLRYAVRSLGRSPGFVAVTALILALGIGANTTIFTLVDQLFFEPPPGVEEPERLVRASPFAAEVPATWWGYPDYAFFRDHTTVFAGLAAFEPDGMAVTAKTGQGGNLRAAAGYVSGNYFDVLGVRPAAGRVFHPEEYDHPGEDAVVVLSHPFAHRAFAGPEDAIGAILRLNGHPFTVIGVAPRGFRGVGPAEIPPDLWLPIMMQPVLSPRDSSWIEREEGRRVTWLQVVGRLADGTSLETARANVDAVAAALAEAFPDAVDEGYGVALLPDYQYVPRIRERLIEIARLLAAVVALVLAIAGANVAILLLARGSARRRELGVRLALGAGRGRIVRQLLVESLLLAGLGGLGGFALAFGTADLAARALPFELAVGFTPDLGVFALTLALSLLVALVFGLAPALLAARVDVVTMLAGARESGRSRLRDALVVVQVALSILLVTGAALFVRSLRAAESVELGFAAEDRLVLSLDLRNHGYDDAAAARFAERAIAEVAAVPGVRRVATGLLTPFRGRWTGNFEADGVERPEGEELYASYNGVSPGYFELMEIPLLAGRDFAPGDGLEAPEVAILNQAAAELVWPGESPIGRTIRLNEDGPPVTVIGLARDASYHELGEDPHPHVYLPITQAGIFRLNVLVHTGPEPLALARPVQEAIHRVDPDVAFTRVETLERTIEGIYGRYRVGARLVTLFGLLALALAAVGLYGVLSYLVIQRRRVIGIQMALGASRERVARSVVSRGLALAATGAVVGLAAAWAAGRLVEGFLYGVDARDPASFLAVPLILAAVAGLASLLPARRASRVDPMTVLRED